MNTSERLPVSSGSQPPAIKRHHTARYYAHRVHESLTTRVSKLICASFLIILFVAGIVAFILWLSLRPHRPRIHIHNFSVPALGQGNGFDNAQIIFNVSARNSNQHIGFYYGKVEGSVYYKDQMIGYTPLLDPFYQEPKNTTVMTGVLGGATLNLNSQRWNEFLNDRSQGTVIFRLDITSTIEFKVSTWHSKNHRMHANCNVGVGPDGSILALYRDKRCPVYFT
ncbi:hypothetical protein JCGZ_21277 [Jatropha curcas]|uniref:Late embryogenesis abundant protein LEA-2 subgroup domain-containing protein n=1 Tax=Jatropha curcas TaxID=180498 RepID=A0A067JAH1_JATCU|nr:NDR1/HIN1-like protein 26 [Jatropha curcas]KDP20806.1 hypothetical protein JCGZ_21277 [Jatropha curcas]